MCLLLLLYLLLIYTSLGDDIMACQQHLPRCWIFFPACAQGTKEKAGLA
jgi:hypothetical protein